VSAPTLSGLPATLLLTLRARAEEHGRPDRLLRDPLAAAWYEATAPLAEDEAALQALYSPAFQLGTAVRARCYDQISRHFLEQHPAGMVVELGAGLSTRYGRLAPAQAQWIELDLPPAIAARRRLEAETARHRFLAASMSDPAWPGRLPPHAAANVLFIAEGVLFFLPPPTIHALFRLLRRHFPGATAAVDLLTREYGRGAGRRFAAAGLPLRWLVTNKNDLAPLGVGEEAHWVVTHLHLSRWEALGFSRERLRESRGNVIVQGRLLPLRERSQITLEKKRSLDA
jgi:O-methyltransferase involved in polyketide biosynthesis